MTDHKAEALSALTEAETAMSQLPGLSVPDLLVAAQVHATLYAAEQTRLLALFTFGAAKREELVFSPDRGELDSWLSDGKGVEGYLTDAEREGLNL